MMLRKSTWQPVPLEFRWLTWVPVHAHLSPPVAPKLRAALHHRLGFLKLSFLNRAQHGAGVTPHVSVLDCRQLQLRSLTAVKSTQALDIELLIEQLQTAQQQQQESSQLLAELEACIASQAAHISDLEQQDRVATRVLAGLKVASTGKAANIELLRAQLQDIQLQLQGTEEQLQAANQTSKQQQQQDQQQLEDLISLLEEQDHVNARVVAGLMANCAHEEAGVKLQTRRLQAAGLQLQGTEQKVAGLQQQLQESQRRAADLEARLQASHQAAKVPPEQLAVLECSNARLADKVAQLQEHLLSRTMKSSPARLVTWSCWCRQPRRLKRKERNSCS